MPQFEVSRTAIAKDNKIGRIGFERFRVILNRGLPLARFERGIALVAVL